jgi:thiamine transporter
MSLKTETKRMLMTINLLAVAVVLDLVVSAIPGLNASMPFGGKFFGLSMFPLVYLDTLRITLESWTGESWGAWRILSLVVLDYVIPFMAFGLSGFFMKSLYHKRDLITGIITVSLVRLASATLSGIILWSSSIQYAVSEVENGNQDPNLATRIFAFVGNSLWVYSLVYNLTYIFTTTVLVIIISLVTYKRLQIIFSPVLKPLS